MDLLHGIPGLKSLPHGTIMSIGNFDGVHRGHARILSRMKDLAARIGGNSTPRVIVTFEPHPLTVLRPELAPPRLTPPPLKQLLLQQQGVDYLVVLPPDREVLDLPAEAFWAILRDHSRISCLVEGPEFNFGKGRGGTIHRLQEWTRGTSVRLELVEPLEVALLDQSIVRVSSTLIRWLIAHGRVRDAGICLGHPYILHGPVVRGYERGRTIGIPTANLDCSQQLIPADGVYAGRCEVAGRTYPAAISIGTMPTFGDNRRQVEAHLIGFSGDLYGQVLLLEIIDWLRDQRKYPSVDALKAQMNRDMQAVQERSTLRFSDHSSYNPIHA